MTYEDTPTLGSGSFILYAYKLEIILGINILLSSFSVLAIYLIALKLYPSKIYALIAAFTYAFFFPLIYFNAFLVSENPSISLLLISLVLLLYSNEKYLLLFLSGVLQGVAIAIRPSFGVAGLPFFLYAWLYKGFSWRGLIRAIVFSSGYFLLLFLVSVNNNANSEGKVPALSPGGGINFYLSSCQTYRVETRFDGMYYVLMPPAAKPEFGTEKFKRPFYDQAFFYQKGMECLKKSNTTFWDRIKRFRFLYFDSMFPMVGSCLFADQAIPFFSLLALGMTVASILVCGGWCVEICGIAIDRCSILPDSCFVFLQH